MPGARRHSLVLQSKSFWIFILNNSAICLVNTKPQNKQRHCQILPKIMCNPYAMKMSSMYHRLLIFDVKRNTKIDGMGPFKVTGMDFLANKYYQQSKVFKVKKSIIELEIHCY